MAGPREYIHPLDLIRQKESGGRNIHQQVVPASVSTASGYYQMINPTWRRWAQGAGVDISRYPRAIDAPEAVQRQVAEYGYAKEGFRPWEAVKHLVGQEKNYPLRPGGGGVLSSQGRAEAPVQVSYDTAMNAGRGVPLPPMRPGPSVVPAEGMGPALPRARNRQEMEEQLLSIDPRIVVTSRDRDPKHNQRVGGAKGSQHLHGTAFDISLKNIPLEERRPIFDAAYARGARGFGYYPKSDSAHIDMRSGPEAYWGPNYSRSSLKQTQPWFQEFAAAQKSSPGGFDSGSAVAADGASTPAPEPGVLAATGDAAPAPSLFAQEAIDGSGGPGGAFSGLLAPQGPSLAAQEAAKPIEPAGPSPAPTFAGGLGPGGFAATEQGFGAPQQSNAAGLMTELLERKRQQRIPAPTGLLS